MAENKVENMRIAVIQASSQADKNSLICSCTEHASRAQVLNLGSFPGGENCTYVETAVAVSLLLSTEAVDFVVTGCSSGQGMMLACNSLPGVFCGYLPTPQDAYLFGRINGGNAASLPLGLGFGWAGEINLQCTLDKLFDGPFGCGWPPEEAERKARDTRQLRELNRQAKRSWQELAPECPDLLRQALRLAPVRKCLAEYGRNRELMDMLASICRNT